MKSRIEKLEKTFITGPPDINVLKFYKFLQVMSKDELYTIINMFEDGKEIESYMNTILKKYKDSLELTDEDKKEFLVRYRHSSPDEREEIKSLYEGLIDAT